MNSESIYLALFNQIEQSRYTVSTDLCKAMELTRELMKKVDELESDIAHAVKEGKQYDPDYPWTENPTASEVAWALGQGKLGVCAANDNLHEQLQTALKFLREYRSRGYSPPECNAFIDSFPKEYK
jgi:hypothetical protein